VKRLLAIATVLLLVSGCDLFRPPPAAEGCFDESTALSSAALRNREAFQRGLELGLPYVPGQVLVKYRAPEAFGLQSLDTLAASVQRDFDLLPLSIAHGNGPDLLEIRPGASVEAVVAALEADPRVEYAEPNYYLYPLTTIPNDPLFTSQWNMLDFGLPQAWAIETGSPDIIIAIIDTGVDTEHEDLRVRLLPGCDFYNEDNDPNPGGATDEPAHGTHVAGIAVAVGNNGRGIAGVAFGGTRAVPIRVFDDSGNQTDAFKVSTAIRWAAGLPTPGVGTNRNPYPAHIINLSLGGKGPISTLNDAVAAARNTGAIVVAAAGNDGRSDLILSPADAPGALAIGSVNQNYQRSSFSNFNDSGRTVDLMAPGGFGNSARCGAGGSIVSTYPEDNYACSAGTSMAAPFVAGVAALIWSQDPSLSASQVIERLKSTTYFDPAWDENEYGAGVVCADRALGTATLCGRP
jgi:serine protease